MGWSKFVVVTSVLLTAFEVQAQDGAPTARTICENVDEVAKTLINRKDMRTAKLLLPAMENCGRLLRADLKKSAAEMLEQVRQARDAAHERARDAGTGNAK